ncbi:hypothetical protein LTR97_007294 [Elasticomyces elasticus]|uniref:Uncharacterized protein n=1 Tax=Elasticomyces elasticus TaxID=574655 RepID=A0AAN7W855_9PEZI|nr:hypothetical protein LTR97_007294 [Elasticomyces elasticus]
MASTKSNQHLRLRNRALVQSLKFIDNNLATRPTAAEQVTFLQTVIDSHPLQRNLTTGSKATVAYDAKTLRNLLYQTFRTNQKATGKTLKDSFEAGSDLYSDNFLEDIGFEKTDPEMDESESELSSPPASDDGISGAAPSSSNRDTGGHHIQSRKRKLAQPGSPSHETDFEFDDDKPLVKKPRTESEAVQQDVDASNDARKALAMKSQSSSSSAESGLSETNDRHRRLSASHDSASERGSPQATGVNMHGSMSKQSSESAPATGSIAVPPQRNRKRSADVEDSVDELEIPAAKKQKYMSATRETQASSSRIPAASSHHNAARPSSSTTRILLRAGKASGQKSHSPGGALRFQQIEAYRRLSPTRKPLDEAQSGAHERDRHIEHETYLASKQARNTQFSGAQLDEPTSDSRATNPTMFGKARPVHHNSSILHKPRDILQDFEGNEHQMSMRPSNQIFTDAVRRIQQGTEGCVAVWCQAHCRDINSEAVFVAKPTKELGELYARLLGTDEWQLRLIELEDREEPWKSNGFNVASAIVAAAVYQEVFLKAMPWDLTQRVREALGDDERFLAETMRLRGYDWDSALKHAAWLKAADVETQEQVMKAHAQKLALETIRIVMPHLKQIAVEPNGKSDHKRLWLEYIERAFLEAVILKSKFDAATDAEFEYLWPSPGIPYDQREMFSEGSRGTETLHTVMPGVRIILSDVTHWIRRPEVICKLSVNPVASSPGEFDSDDEHDNIAALLRRPE